MSGNFKRVVKALLFLRRLKAKACKTRELDESRMWERLDATPCFSAPSYEEEMARTASEKIAEKRRAKAKTMTMLDKATKATKATKLTESTKAETASAKSKMASVLAKATVLAKAAESSDSEYEFDFKPISRCKTRM